MEEVKMREFFSKMFIRGSGIEIGALNMPTVIDTNFADVKYVDFFSNIELKEVYGEIAQEAVSVDIVEDGEKLISIKDESLDFIIANHMLEHCENFFKTILLHYQKLNKGGVLFYTIPDKRFSFDIDRDITTLEHFVEDLKVENTDNNEDYMEWIKKVNKVTGDNEVSHSFESLCEQRYRIHFHVFNVESIMSAMEYLKNNLIDIQIETVTRNINEVLIILRKF